MTTFTHIHLFAKDLDVIRNENGRVAIDGDHMHFHLAITGSATELRQLGEAIVEAADQIAAGNDLFVLPWPPPLAPTDEEISDRIRTAVDGEVADLTLADVAARAEKLESA